HASFAIDAKFSVSIVLVLTWVAIDALMASSHGNKPASPIQPGCGYLLSSRGTPWKTQEMCRNSSCVDLVVEGFAAFSIDGDP
ncbi:MAG TPA: hypothetical protein VMK12_13090, partial [Anaeromyxobacteraceae bacterium]|nr:hypothetical protein [Anaeromyxobacteraceae bacterium]